LPFNTAALTPSCLPDVAEQKRVITTLAVVGMVISMFAFSTAIYYVFGWVGLIHTG